MKTTFSRLFALIASVILLCLLLHLHLCKIHLRSISHHRTACLHTNTHAHKSGHTSIGIRAGCF